MLVDANILLFAVDEKSAFHDPARRWLIDRLNGPGPLGFPWSSLVAFLRIGTHPAASERPLSPAEAWGHVVEWLDTESAWIPTPTPRHADILGSLLSKYHVRGNLVVDADLAALAIEHGVAVASTDTDFARFTEIRWENPVAPT